MADKTKSRKPIYSPKGTFLYPKFLTPDTKFDPEGVYSVRLVLDGEAAASLIEKIDEEIEATYQAELENAGIPAKRKKVKKADAPYQPEEDDEGNETGNVIFNFKLKAVGKNSKTGETWKNVVKLYDAKGSEIVGAKKKALKIGSGTIGKVCFQMNPFYTAQVGAGVSLRLLAAQIIELIEFGGGYQFGEEEGGFSADDYEADEEGFEDETEEDQDEEEDDGDEDF